jgi:parallel beta-helix repeat protein
MNMFTPNKRFGGAPGFLLCLAFAVATPAFATTYYIATTGNDGNNGTSTGTAWATMAHAMSTIPDGVPNTIVVLDGTYTEQFNITKSGNSTTNLVIQAQNVLGAELDATGKTHGIWIQGNYIRVDGFVVHNANGAGISIDNNHHHIHVLNCESYHNKKAGIYASGSDFLWIEHNEVYDDAWGSGQVTSGISIHLPKNVTGNTTDTTTPRFYVRWNIVHGNYETATNPTDGAGIILDDLRCAASSTLPIYEFPAVVEDNLCYFNGGPGIKLFSTRYITCRNNTCYKNNSDQRNGTWRAEISIINCDDVDVVNNIAASDVDAFSVDYSQNGDALADSNRTPFGNFTQDDRVKNGQPNPHPTYTGDNDNIVWKNNLLYTYNGTTWTNTTTGQSVPTTGSPDYNKIGTSPGFVNAASLNFRLTSASAAKNNGTTALGYENEDLDGNSRPQGTNIDIGCYERVE